MDEEVAKLQLPALREELTSSRILFAVFLKAGLVMNIVAVVIGILIIYGMKAVPSQRVSNFVESCLGWSCSHCGFPADYLQCRQSHPQAIP